LEVKTLWVQDLVIAGRLKVAPVPGTENVADVVTKVLSAQRIEFLKKKISVKDVKDLSPRSGVAPVFALILAARAKAAVTLVAMMATGASSGAVAVTGQSSDVCQGVAALPQPGYYMVVAATIFLVGLVVGIALSCCCLRPFCQQRPTPSDNMMVVTFEMAWQSKVTYTRNAGQPRFKPLPESSHGSVESRCV
jgi:hypothetical protein